MEKEFVQKIQYMVGIVLIIYGLLRIEHIINPETIEPPITVLIVLVLLGIYVLWRVDRMK